MPLLCPSVGRACKAVSDASATVKGSERRDNNNNVNRCDVSCFARSMAANDARQNGQCPRERDECYQRACLLPRVSRDHNGRAKLELEEIEATNVDQMQK
jgi:hypothetical protein